ncbi:MAG: flagellar biosynthetic protein FliQ [Stellaceae bacterium]
MTAFEVTMAARHVLLMTLLLVSPFLGIGLVIGLLVSLFQAGTRMNDLTLHFVPRMLAIMLILAVAGGWMGERMTNYIRNSAAQMVSNLE